MNDFRGSGRRRAFQSASSAKAPDQYFSAGIAIFPRSRIRENSQRRPECLRILANPATPKSGDSKIRSPKPEKSRSPALLRFFLSAPGCRIGYSICRTVFPPRYSKSKLAFNGTPHGDVVPDYSASLTSSTSDRPVSNSNDNRRLSG